MARHLLEVENLHVHFDTDAGTVRAVDGVSFHVDRGETVCLVGESGSGKTVTSESITRLVESPPGRIAGGTVRFDGENVLSMSDDRLREVRGGRIGHVFQNPQGALNPVYTVGWQIREAVQLHSGADDETARARAVELLGQVGIPEAAARYDDYPHEFSGGMKQRVVIAMALAAEPDLLIADEPTTALDVTIQNQILGLLADLQSELGMSVLLITHDLGVVAQVADRVVVMYAGKVMEHGDVFDVFERPSHPYTRALLDCLPGRGTEMRSIGGTLPSPTDPPDGCRFHPRCPHAVDQCRVGDQPPLVAAEDADARGAVAGTGTGDDEPVDAEGHGVSCVYYGPGPLDPATITEGDDTAAGAAGRTDGGVADADADATGDAGDIGGDGR